VVVNDCAVSVYSVQTSRCAVVVWLVCLLTRALAATRSPSRDVYFAPSGHWFEPSERWLLHEQRTSNDSLPVPASATQTVASLPRDACVYSAVCAMVRRLRFDTSRRPIFTKRLSGFSGFSTQAVRYDTMRYDTIQGRRHYSEKCCGHRPVTAGADWIPWYVLF